MELGHNCYVFVILTLTADTSRPIRSTQEQARVQKSYSSTPNVSSHMTFSAVIKCKQMQSVHFMSI